MSRSVAGHAPGADGPCDYNDVSLPQGSFTVTLAGINFGYFFTPKIYVQSLVQYADQIDTWSANVRFGWPEYCGNRPVRRLQRSPRD